VSRRKSARLIKIESLGKEGNVVGADGPTRTKMLHELPAHNQSSAVLATLRRFARSSATQEKCELCTIGLPPDHRHLLELSIGRIICSCDACALRFLDVVDGRFKLIPRKIRSLSQFRLTDYEWDDLALPISLAFFHYSTLHNKMKATYPSPAGATESLLSLDAWQALASNNPVLTDIAPDVEALLVNRVDPRREYYIVPIDVCFELVGVIRLHWKGLSGGDLVWKEIANFFDRLRKAALPNEAVP
jgi:Family of unknown function (DUF5947)